MAGSERSNDGARRFAAVGAGVVLVAVSVAGLHGLYRAGDEFGELITWIVLLLGLFTALGGGVKLIMWGFRPVIRAAFDAAKERLSEPVQAVAASGAVIAGALGMWWTFRGGYISWWQHLTGESQWSLLLGVGQMLVAVLAGAALFGGGRYLTGLVKEVLSDAGVLIERDRAAGKRRTQEGLWHPGLVAALVGGGLGLVLLTAGIAPRLYVWITGPDVLPAVGAIALVLLWAIGSNLGWWKGLGGLYKWATDASQKAAAMAGVVAVLMFSAGGLGLGWFTPATVPQARAACPPDCGGPGGSDGPPGGGQMFQPPSQGGPQMPDYQGGVNQPPMDQNGSVSIYNTQAPSISNNGAHGSSGQQGPQQGWDQPAHGSQPSDYQNATPYTQGPGRPNPDFNPGSQGAQTNAGSQGGQANQGAQQSPVNQGNQSGQQPPSQNNSGQQPNQSDQQKIDDLTRQLQQQQQQSGQDNQKIDDLTKQLQNQQGQQKQNGNQKLPKAPSKDKKKDDKKDEQDDRDKQSGDNDLVGMLLGAASTRRRKQDDQEQGPDTQALGQDASQAAQGLPGDVQTYVQSGQQIGQSSGQAAQGFGSAAQAGASLASSAQSGAVNPQDAITLVQGVSQGVQGTADAVNAGSQIVKTAQKEADQAAQAVGDVNPQLKPQMQQLTQLNDQASQVTDLVGQGAQLTSQGAGAVNTVSSLGAGGGGVPDAGSAGDALSQGGTTTVMSSGSGPGGGHLAASPVDFRQGPPGPLPMAPPTPNPDPSPPPPPPPPNQIGTDPWDGGKKTDDYVTFDKSDRMVHDPQSKYLEIQDQATGYSTLFNYDKTIAGLRSPDGVVKYVSGTGGPFEWANSNHPSNPTGDKIVGAATQYLGLPYTWGGGHEPTPGPWHGYPDVGDPTTSALDASVVGLDCSGFSRASVFNATGIDLKASDAGYSNTDALLSKTITPNNPNGKLQAIGSDGVGKASLSAAQPGDLLFFGKFDATGAGSHHVAIFAGWASDNTPVILEEPGSGGVAHLAPQYHGDLSAVRRLAGGGS